YHVVEHFSQHTGQIVYATKLHRRRPRLLQTPRYEGDSRRTDPVKGIYSAQTGSAAMTRRREFLSAAGAAAVYNLAAAQTAPSPKPVSANDTVTLGFVGVGIRGTQLMHEFSEIPGVR